ncbi:MAG: methyltransferase domain-containing protein [Candidatus Faecivivens sp.]|nr:methyltransferase domain-containing protein [Candidatus Faecivivens sp.]
MNEQKLKTIWLKEEQAAKIHGWDFSHIAGRYDEERDLPWNYEQIVRENLRDQDRLLDYDTGGGEFLLSLGHPFEKTAATEGYPPNAALCAETLRPLGIDFKVCDDPSAIPFADKSFDRIINRHCDFDAKELYRLLKKGGIFITEQVGSENDRDLVEEVLPEVGKPFPDLTLDRQREIFESAGFTILRAEEAFRPIVFTDIGAFVWFARIVEWEFPGFSVERCFPSLLRMQKRLETNGKIEGTIHRFLIVAKK